MTSHPSRWIAPLALLAALLAVWLVIQASTGDSDDGGGSEPTSQQQEQRETSDSEGETSARTTPAEPKRKTYRVRPGDTLALIAERTGVTVEELLELNPDIDPNSLSVGERIRLSE
jgi:LysM repeat protein